MSNAIVITWVNVQQVFCFVLAAGCVLHLRIALFSSNPQSLSMPAIGLCAGLCSMAYLASDTMCSWLIIIGFLAIVAYVLRTTWFMVKIGSMYGQVTSLRVYLADWTDLQRSCICLAVCIGIAKDDMPKSQPSDAIMAVLGDMLREMVRLGILEARYHGSEFRWAGTTK